MFVFGKLQWLFPATRILFIAILIEYILCAMYCGYIDKYGKAHCLKISAYLGDQDHRLNFDRMW